MVRKMVKATGNTVVKKTQINIKEHTKKIENTVMENSNGALAVSIRVTTRVTKKMASERCSGRTEASIEASGKEVSSKQ